MSEWPKWTCFCPCPEAQKSPEGKHVDAMEVIPADLGQELARALARVVELHDLPSAGLPALLEQARLARGTAQMALARYEQEVGK